MALVLKDRVRETSTTTGTGSFTLGGTSTGFQSFSVIGDGNTTYYGIVNSVAGEWEVGIGTYTASGTVLSRDTILESSNGGSAVNFSAGTKDVFVTYPAEKSASTDTFASPPAIGNTTPAAATFTTLTATGTSYFGGSSTSRNVQVDPVAAATSQYTQFSRNVAINEQQIIAASTANLGLVSTGGGTINFWTATSGEKQFVVGRTASAVNYVQVTGAATGGGVSVTAQGSDSNVFLDLKSKGSYPITFYTGTTAQFTVAHTASAVNRLQVTGAAAGSAPVLSSFGSDTNIDLTLTPKGTGTVVANGPFTATGQTSLGGAAGSESFRAVVVASQNRYVETRGGVSGSTYPAVGVGGGTEAFGVYSNLNLLRFNTQGYNSGLQMAVSHTASAVNYVQVTGAATGSAPNFQFTGSDANVLASFGTKGTGSFSFYSNGLTNRQVRIDGSATAVNYIDLYGSASGNAIAFKANGSDTNISQVFQSKGTGAIDLAAGSSGVNISNGGTVTAITRTATGSGYTSIPSVAITSPTTAGGVQATASANLFANTATIASGGTGYTNGDVLTIVGGTPNGSAATYTVTGVSAGVVTSVTPLNFGSYSALAANPVSVTGGTGTGATLNLTYGISTPTITNAGSGYVEQPTVSFSGGGGSGAAAYATVGSGTVIRSLGSTGAQSLDFYTPSSITSNIPALRLRDVSGADSYVMIAPNPLQAQIVAQGIANANLLVAANGTGRVSLQTNGTSQTEQLRVSHTASAVNYVQVTGATTGNPPTLSPQGSDSTIAMLYVAKGGQDHRFFSNTGSAEQFRVLHTAGTMANHGYATGAAAGSAPVFGVRGSDTNIDLTLTPKGTGKVIVGGSGGLRVNRIDSSNEGGQLDLCRSSDNASAWAIDVYGSTSTPDLRFVDNTAAATRAEIDSSGNFKFNSGYGSVATAYGCRAWVNFNGTGTVAIRASGNVSSITDNGTGNYTVNFTTAMPDASYTWVINGQIDQSAGANVATHGMTVVRSAGAVSTGSIQIMYGSGTSLSDYLQSTVAIFR